MPLGLDIIQHATDKYLEGQKEPDILGQYQKMQALKTMQLQQQDIASQVQERNAIAAQRQSELHQSTSAARAIHDHIAAGGSLDDPELQQKLYAVAPKLADAYVTTRSQAAERAATAKKTQYELDHPKIDPLSPEGIAANIQTKKGEPRNIDPLSPEGVAAAVARTTQEATVPQRPQGVQQPPQPTPPMSPGLFEQRKGLAKIQADAAAARAAASNPLADDATVKYIAAQVEANPLNWNLTGGNKQLQNQVRERLAAGGNDVNRLSMATRQLGETADTVVPKIDSLIKKLDNPKFVANLGPIMGRWNEFWTGKIGTNDPDLANIRAQIGLTQTGVMRAHVGARGGAGMLEKFEGLADSSKMDAATLKGSLTGIRDFLQGYRDKIHPTGGAAKATHRYNPATGQIEEIK